MFKKILLAGALSIASSFAVAAPIVGGFSLNDASGSVLVDSVNNTVQFTPNPASFEVMNTFGDFNAYNGDTSGLMNNFTYTDTLGALSIPNLFTFSTFTFNVFTIYSVYESAQSTIGNANIDLWGYGVLTDSSNVFDDTVMEWNFNNSRQTWSATAVPAPATLALLGAGLIGMALVKRRKQRAA